MNDNRRPALVADEDDRVRRRMGQDPVVIDRRGLVWAYADWDFELHEPLRGVRPRR